MVIRRVELHAGSNENLFFSERPGKHMKVCTYINHMNAGTGFVDFHTPQNT